MLDHRIFLLFVVVSVFQFCTVLSINQQGVEKLLKIQLRDEYLLEQFLLDEFSYKGAEDLINPMTDLPFRDIHADNFFKAGVIKISHLRQYIEGKNHTKLFGPLKLKPWVSIEVLKNELAKCGKQYNYVSTTQQIFSYNKQIYGTMNIMKFACRYAFDDVIVYGVGMERFRFRFKDVLLNKIQRYWASTARTITIRDMQKLMNYFSSRFAASMQEHFEREVKKLTAITDEIENEEDELGITDEPEFVEPKTITPKIVKKVIIKPKRKHKLKLHTTKTSTLTSTSTTTTTTTTTTPPSIFLTTEINEEENSIPNVEDYETTTTNEVETDVDNSETETTDSEYFETTTTISKPEYPEVTDTTEEPESIAFYPFVTSNHGCVQMDSNYNETARCNNLKSMPLNAKEKLFALFPSDEIEELPYMTKDHTFQFASFPLTIRIMLTNPAKVPEILDIFHKDMSAESRDVMENCIDEYCDEPDEIVEKTPGEDVDETNPDEHHPKDTHKFFQDRALRYNLSPNSTLLVYASSTPQFQLEAAMRRKNFNAKRIITRVLPSDTKALWHDFMESQVAETFAVHHRPALLEHF